MVTCSTVRDLLTEHALGVAGPRESAAVERHLAWCAACRKESQDLARASATLGFALPPAMPDAELEHRVVHAVHAVSGTRTARPRRARRAGVLVVAAAVALSGLGVGAVIARRSDPDDQIAATSEQAKDAFDAFRRMIEDSRLVDPGTAVFLGVLGPEGTGQARGTAMTIVVPTIDDQAVVMVTGLTDRRARLPYRVAISDRAGNVVQVGRLRELDPGGEATVAVTASRDLTPFTNVVVTDARDRVVLRGTLRERTSVPSPSP